MLWNIVRLSGRHGQSYFRQDTCRVNHDQVLKNGSSSCK
uniref:Uncharacterized protein n=1 Tax=Anguilla anguilla TaxID=7936 RepID=A0A0E9Q7I0_ANGAN